MPETKYTSNVHVRVDECGPEGVVRIGALCNYLQEAAWRHAELLGYGRQDMLDQGLAWVMTRMRLLLERLPGPGEALTVLTWPSARDKYLAYRDFTMQDACGTLVCRATTAWAHMDIAERRMVLIRENGCPFPREGERALEFKGRSVPRLREGEHTCDIISRRSDLDVNGHVNNVHFVSWALESLPEAERATRRLVEIDVSYRQECLAGLPVRSACADTGTAGEWRHSLQRVEDGAELARMCSQWRDE